MNKRSVYFILFLILLSIYGITACSHRDLQPQKAFETKVNETPETQTFVPESLSLEYYVISIPLADEISSPRFEFSGLAWYQGDLVLLPQYPNGILGEEEGMIYAIPADVISRIIVESNTEAEFYEINFDDGGLRSSLNGFEGFESIEFIGNSIYLTIETHGGNPMKSFLVKGKLEVKDQRIESISLFADKIVELKAQNSNKNASYEALTTDGEYLYALFEQYGYEQNPNPYVIKLDQDLNIISELSIDPVNYRLTDATAVEEDGHFWMINYFYPGDEHLKVSSDPISMNYSLPESHQMAKIVERLLKFQVRDDQIFLMDEPPVYLRLLESKEARNWEGIVAIPGIGFFVITDSFPDSILGFIKIQ